MALKIHDEWMAGHRILCIEGDLDLRSGSQPVDAAIALIKIGVHDLIVDAHLLVFCDSSGLAALVRIAQMLEPGGRLAINDCAADRAE